MSKPQVRLDPDVAEALGRDAERKGTSLNLAANTWLRRALGLPAMGTQVAERPESGPPARAASLTPARQQPSTVSATCPPHPANRRIGPYCAACQQRVVDTPKPHRP